MRALRLAPALLLALGACRADTDALKPTTDAECAARDPSTKACGYRCVSVNDPATGCAAPDDCAPCPAPVPNTVGACSPAGECAVYCAAGWSDCNVTGPSSGDGCEVLTGGSDSTHCGSCTRVCPSGVCTDGACDGVAITTLSPVTPRDLEEIGGRLYYVDAGTANPGSAILGAIWSADTSTTVAGQTGAASRWLAAYQAGLLFSGRGPSSLGLGTLPTLPGTPTPWNVLPAVSGTDEIAGLAALGAHAFFSADEQDGVWYFDGAAPHLLQAAAPGVKGFAAHPASGRVYFGTTANGGEIRYTEVTAAGPSTPVVLWEGTGHPSRIAVFDDPSRTYPVPLVFWISEDDGSVRGARSDGAFGIVTLVEPQSAAPVHADIVADAHGVYWSNWLTGRLQMWRASDDRVLELGVSHTPFALAVRHPLVYWTDELRGKILTVPVP